MMLLYFNVKSLTKPTSMLINNTNITINNYYMIVAFRVLRIAESAVPSFRPANMLCIGADLVCFINALLGFPRVHLPPPPPGIIPLSGIQ